MQIFEIVTDDTLRALTSNGTPEFQFEYYLDEIEKYNNQCVQWHWHNEFEFVSVTSGPVDCLIGDNRIKLSTGEGLFINSGMIHRFESTENGRMVCILFAPEFFAPKSTTVYDKFIAPILSSSFKYMVFSKEYEWQRDLLDTLGDIYFEAREQCQTRELNIQIRVASLWKHFFRNVHETLIEENNSGNTLLQARMHTMLDYIHRNYSEHITVDSIANAASISKSEALRCFHMGVQTTPVNYLIEYRLNAAKEKLLTTLDTVSSIALSAGFGSAGYFNRVFHKAYGMTPMGFRKKFASR